MRAKRSHKNGKKFRNFMFWSAGCSLLMAEGFCCSLDVLYGGLGICQNVFVFSCKFFQFLVIKTPIRIGIQPKMLVPDPDSNPYDIKWIRVRNTVWKCWFFAATFITDKNREGMYFIHAQLQNSLTRICGRSNLIISITKREFFSGRSYAEGESGQGPSNSRLYCARSWSHVQS